MRRRKLVRNTLGGFAESLQGRGRYVFRRHEALASLGVSGEALQAAARRLVSKRRLAMPRRGFFVIVPVEYKSAGSPPADWFLGELMKHQGRPYYLGILSAAALHGAAHQQPQEVQVVTNGPLRPVRVGRVRIRFFTKRRLDRTPIIEARTETGVINVSTPEATALDLVRYASSAGHLANVATVLSELSEKLDPGKLVEAARADVEITYVQRLGYLLDLVGASKIARPLAEWLATQRPRTASLRTGRPSRKAPKSSRWFLSINEKIEVDL